VRATDRHIVGDAPGLHQQTQPAPAASAGVYTRAAGRAAYGQRHPQVQQPRVHDTAEDKSNLSKKAKLQQKLQASAESQLKGKGAWQVGRLDWVALPPKSFQFATTQLFV
jgi:hypothetical protein